MKRFLLIFAVLVNKSNYVDKEINNSIWGEKLKIFAKTGILNSHTVANGVIFIIIWSSIYHAKN